MTIKLKKKIFTILLGVSALAFVASTGVAVYSANAEGGAAQPVLTMQTGAAIRTFAPTGIRFVSEISKTDYETLTAKNAEFYTLIIPEKLVPEGGITEGNYMTDKAERVQAKNSIVVAEDKVTFSGTLVGTQNETTGDFADFPETFYNVPLTAVSYYTYTENEVETVVFASNPQTYSIAYIASSLQADGQTDPYYTTITDAVLSDGISFGANSYSLKENETIATTLNSQGLKAVYSSDNESVVTVDKDGKLTGVGLGATNVRANIGGKTAIANVTVSKIFGSNPTYSDGTGMFAESVDENGKVSVKPAKFAYSERGATFNIEASTQYYAEATFTYNVTKDWPVIGLAHFNALNTTIADGDAYNNAGKLLGRRCIESVLSNSGKFIIKDLKPTDDHWYEGYQGNHIYLNASFKANATFTTMTIAIARTEDKMYTFVDGVLVKEYDVPADYSGATTPGIISCGALNDFTASNITVLSGTEAQTKLYEAITAAASIKSVFGNNPTLSNGSKLYTEAVAVSSDKNGEFAATFNMEASTQYYAEATFYVTDTSNYPAFGLAHYLALKTSVNETGDVYNNAGSRLGRVCVASVKSNSSAKFLITNLTASNQQWYSGNKYYDNANFQANNFTQMTIAIARTADKMYTFVNGVLVQEMDAPEGYKDVATTPGIITICNANLFIASNIQLLNGTDAQNKITELTTATTP